MLQMQQLIWCVFVCMILLLCAATTVSPAAHGTTNSVDAKFAAAFGNAPAIPTQKSG